MPGRQRPQSGREGRRFRFSPRRLLAPLAIGLVGALVIAIIVVAVIRSTQGGPSQSAAAEREQDQDPSLPGQWMDPGAVYPDTADHVSGTVPFCEETITVDAQGRPTCYSSNPPTSGPHGDTPAPRGIYSEPIPREQLLHNMEHGGVVIWYNCSDCDETVASLREIAEGFLRDGRDLVMTPYADMEADTIALTAWSRLDKFSVDEYSEERLRTFVEAHERRFNPEDF